MNIQSSHCAWSIWTDLLMHSMESHFSNIISPFCTLGEGLGLSTYHLDGAVQSVLLHLLQIARAECILQFVDTLGNKDLYERAYFRDQPHFSLAGIVGCALEAAAQGGTKPVKVIVQTRTTGQVLSLLKWQDGNEGVHSSGFWAAWWIGELQRQSHRAR